MLSALYLDTDDPPPFARALVADAVRRAAILMPKAAVPARRPAGLPALGLAAVALAGAALFPTSSRAARVLPTVATAAPPAPLPAGALDGEREVARAAAEAARRLGDARLASLAAEFDRALRQLGGGTLSDPAALDFLRALEERAAEAARAAKRDARATEIAARALEATQKHARLARRWRKRATDRRMVDRSPLLSAPAARPTRPRRPARWRRPLRIWPGPAGESADSAEAKDGRRRLSRDDSRAVTAPPETGRETSDPEARHLEKLRRDLEEAASACRAGDSRCRQRSEERGRELAQLGRQGAAQESLQRLQRSAEQLRARVARGELGESDPQAMRNFGRAANGKRATSGGSADDQTASGEAGEGEMRGAVKEGAGSSRQGPAGGPDGTEGAETAAASAAMAAEGGGASREQEPSGNGTGIGHQPGGAPLGARRGDTKGTAGSETDVRLADGAGPGRAEAIGTAAGRGFASPGYARAFTDYAAAVEDALGGTAVPEGKRYLVRRYFDSDPPAPAGARPGEHPVSAARPNELDVSAEAVTAAVVAFRTDLDRLLSEIGRRLVGQTDVVGAVASAMLAGGHVLVEGVPGLGKTLLVRTAAAALDLTFSRVQFTPDLMPADVIGTNLIVDDAAGRRFEFQKGPIFAHIVLADEINRATPKTQSALLEAMQEQSVTVGKQTYALPPPFFVLATQNPIEMEGTYPLPEAQLDRFLFKLRALPPSGAELHQILDRTTGAPEEATRAVLGRDRLLEMRALVRQVPVARPIQDFVVRLVEATDPSRSPISEVARFVRYGSSPRGAQALILGAKIEALRAGRFAPSFADVRRVAIPALRHRVLLNFDGEAEGITADILVDKLLSAVPEIP